MRFKLAITSLTALVVAAISTLSNPVPALAVMSSFEGGNFYYAKDITKGTDFGDPISAGTCDEIQYRIRVHNPGPSDLSNVTVQAAFTTQAIAQNVSLATLRSPDASPSNVSDSATVNLPSAQKLTYEANSTQLLDANEQVIHDYVDGVDNTVTLNGITVNIGTLGVSLNETRFVQFKEKVNCPPPTPTPPVTPPTTPPTVTPAAAPAPTKLVNTGPGDVAALFGGTTAAGTFGYRWMLTRRRK